MREGFFVELKDCELLQHAARVHDSLLVERNLYCCNESHPDGDGPFRNNVSLFLTISSLFCLDYGVKE